MRAFISLAVALFALVGCAAAGEGAADGEVVVKHAFGSDSYPRDPERVVAAGSGVDNLLALGVTPVAVVETADDVTPRWREPLLDGVDRIAVDDIASVEPDLIVGDGELLDESLYRELAAIAPTLGPVDGGEASGWHAQLRDLGRIFRAESEAADVILEDHRRMEQARDDMAGLRGKTVVVARYWAGAFYVPVDDTDPATEFFAELGMRTPDSMTVRAAYIDNGRAVIPKGKIEDLGVHFMVLDPVDGIDAVRMIPGYQALPQVRSGAVAEDGSEVAAALKSPSALSRQWVLEQVGDRLELAASG